MISRTKNIVLIAVPVLATYFAMMARAQDAAPLAPDSSAPASAETCRLRVENAQYGGVEISIDGGAHYLLIGRVQKPAAALDQDKSAVQPGTVVRSSRDGIAFSVTVGHVLKLLPVTDGDAHGSRTHIGDSAIVTDIRKGIGLFGDLCPPPGTPTLQQSARGTLRPFPDGYVPAIDDVFALTRTLSAQGTGKASGAIPASVASTTSLTDLRRQITTLSEQYASQAIVRAREQRRSIVSGTLVLRAKLPVGEPEPITAVTFSVDGDIVSAQNIFPSVYAWDTKRVANGEHVIEIRALSKYATVITRLRTLVIVNNE